MMKRQQNITDFFGKFQKIDAKEKSEHTSYGLNLARDETSSEHPPINEKTFDKTSEDEPIDDGENECGVNNELPECWNQKQAEMFKEKYEYLLVANRKLGCEACAELETLNIKSIHISKSWASHNIEGQGKNRTVRQASLRKKMHEHFTSKAHNLCVAELKQREKLGILAVDKINDGYASSTEKVFNTVYSIAKRNLPFSSIEDEIELQIKNGLDMGVGLHSRKTAVEIVEHIAGHIKQTVFGKIIQQNLKICVIIDEASTISSKAVLIIFVKGEDDDFSPTIFLDLVELEAQDAETIYVNLLRSLNNVGFDNQYLKLNLIALCSDGASVMLGKLSGVSTRLQNDFPDVIIWHCLSHRLQLVLDDSIKDIKHVNHFKIFIDDIYKIFHQSNKNQMELFQISQELCAEIIKIGRVLGPRWAACSLRSTVAVWRAYPALFNYFSNKAKFSGMANRFANRYFLEDLALMIDILTEISLLSNALQSRDLNITRAEKLMKRSIKALEMMKESKGPYETKLDETLNSEAFLHIPFVQSKKCVNIPRQSLIESIVKNMKLRLMDHEDIKSCTNSKEIDSKIHDLVNLVNPDTWPIDEIVVPWKSAEEKLPRFNKQFHHEICVNDFRDYVENVIQNRSNQKIPDTILKAKNIINTIALSSAEAERGFSTMNLIYSDKRNRLVVSNVSNLLIIKLIGLPLNLWNAKDSVKMWLRKNHSADDTTVKHSTAASHNSNELSIWKYMDYYGK